MKREDALNILANEPLFWSRLGFCYDPPRASADGRQIIFQRDFSRYQRWHDDFSGIGVNVHSTIIHSGWVGDGRYDYEATDATVEAVLKGHPERWYVPRVKLNAPVEWCKKHPQEVFVYYGGPQTPEEIAALVGGEKQDWFGFDSADGYPVNGGFYQDDRPNVGGMVGLQSFSSEQWLLDATEALKRFLAHMENGPYGQQILGYHIAFGCCGETTLWGAWRAGGENRRGDYGIGHQRAFWQWAMARHGGLTGLRVAWKQPFLTEENMVIPAPNDRESAGQSLSEMFGNEMLRDYHEFLSHCSATAIERFGRTVHEECGKPAGAFYGYLVVPQAPYSGHLNLDQVLNSPHVDFLASPRAYQYALAGEPGGEQGPTQSMNRKKIWMDELDNWTHLDMRKRANAAKDMDETRTLLWREVAKNLACAQNFWWMDLGDGWYDSEEVMGELATLYRLTKRWRGMQRHSTAQVLAVVDEEAIKCASVSYGLAQGLQERLMSELRLSGAMIDLYCARDLLEMELAQYRLVVFLNPFSMSKETWAAIRARLAGDVTVLWNYAVGVRGGEYSLERVHELTGFHVTERACGPSEMCYEDIKKDFPALSVCSEEGVKAVWRAKNGDILLACSADGKRYLAAEPMLRVNELRPIMERAGVRLAAPAQCTVYEDSRFTAVFPKGNNAGRVRFPEEGKYRLLCVHRGVAEEDGAFHTAGKGFVFYERCAQQED